MKLTCLTALLLATATASADLNGQVAEYRNLFGDVPSNTTIMNRSSLNRGKEMRPKTILRGVFYIGGSDVLRATLSPATKQFLCQAGFSGAYSVYVKANESVSCGGASYNYRFIGQAPDRGNGPSIRQLLGHLHQVITSNGAMGPVFLHCHYGVHASNTIAQIALKQFCGIGDQQAAANWDRINYMNSLPRQNVQMQYAKIQSFQPYPELRISEEQRRAVCF